MLHISWRKEKKSSKRDSYNRSITIRQKHHDFKSLNHFDLFFQEIANFGAF